MSVLCDTSSAIISATVVRFQVFTVETLKMTVFCNVAPHSPIIFYRSFRDANYLNHRTYDGGSKHLLEFVQFLRDYKAQNPRRRHLVCSS